jgi:molecular chaperone IbpA
MMKHNDPLFSNFLIGAERLRKILADAESATRNINFPPFNLEQEGENDYRLTLAVAGFKEAELDISVHDRKLTVVGNKADKTADAAERTFIHKGIAERGFTREFGLDEYVEVDNARLEDGLLSIALKRNVPESAKPRSIKIG